MRIIQPAGAGAHSTDNIASQRSEIREREERLEQRAETPVLTSTQRAGQHYAELYRREQEQKQQERARLIAEGKIEILPNGTVVEHHKGFGW